MDLFGIKTNIFNNCIIGFKITIFNGFIEFLGVIFDKVLLKKIK